jgi:exosortase/archaeosortase family protein
LESNALSERQTASPKATFNILVVASAIIFLLLPVTTTFNELLTRIVESTGLYKIIQGVFVPIEARVLAGVLTNLLGIQATVANQGLILQSGNLFQAVYLNWNCIGWQSLMLYTFTIITGLRGPFTRNSKAMCVAIGLEGTILLNIGRVTLVILVALFWGGLPALIFHQYAGTLLVLIWLVAFWELSYGYILQPILRAKDSGRELLQEDAAPGCRTLAFQRNESWRSRR